MTPISVSDFAERCGGEIKGQWSQRQILGFALDNREVKSGDLFLAIRGAKVDGHDFVESALSAGAVGALVERPVPGPHILVPNLVDALAAYAKSRRMEFEGQVVGITGSAGKTSTKEFVAAALRPMGPILKTQGNRNTEYTCPLVWTDLTPEHAAVVVELSMRGPGQIRHLASFCLPTIAVVTNIGYSHIELVGSRHGIAEAKAEIFEYLPEDGHAVIPEQDEFADLLRSRSKAPVATFGFGEGDCRVTAYEALTWSSCRIEGQLGRHRWEAILPTVGKHMALNAASAILVAHIAGIPVERSAESLAKVELPPMRMEIRRMGGVTFVLDTYNASPSSTIAALETLFQMPAQGRKMAILGEMRELGDLAKAGHYEVGAALADYPVDRAIVFGESTDAIQEGAIEKGFSATVRVPRKEDIPAALGELREGDVILIKGSRALELETVLDDMEAQLS